MFSIIRHTDIDRTKWELISAGGSIFSQGWFLDHFCVWDLLIYGDYEGGMPIAVRKRFGFTEVYQPGFIQKSEWCGALPSGQEAKIKDLLYSQYHHVHFNSDLLLPQPLVKRQNFYLPLNRSAESLRDGYRTNAKRNIRKQAHLHLTLQQSNDLQKSIQLYKKAYGSETPHLTPADYDHLLKAFESDQASGSMLNFHVLQEGEVVSVLLFYIYNKRMHYVLGAQTATGRKINAMTIAFDMIITDPKNQGVILDFEGSNIESVAHFYKGFGSELEFFYEYKWTRSGLFRILSGLKKLFG